MAASTNDKITDTRNAARPNSARATGTRNAAGTSLACDNLAGWPTASKVHFVTYTVNSSSVPVAGSQLDCSGIVSGNTINSISVLDGTDLGNSVGDYVEMIPTASWGQDLADVLTSTHNRSGGLKTAITLDIPTITNYANGQHTHANAAGGGQLTGSSALVNSSVSPDKLATGAATATVAASQTTTSSTFGDLGTTGPSVTVTIGVNGIVLMSLGANMVNSTSDYCILGVVISGANSVVATQYELMQGTSQMQFYSTFLLTGLTPGSTTFKLQYKNNNNSSTATFIDRKLAVVPL